MKRENVVPSTLDILPIHKAMNLNAKTSLENAK